MRRTDFLPHKMFFPLEVYPISTLDNDSVCLGLLQGYSEEAIYFFAVSSSNVVWKDQEVLSCSSRTLFCAKIAYDRTLVWISKLQENIDAIEETTADVSLNDSVVFCSVRITQDQESSFFFFWTARSDGSLVNRKQTDSDIVSLFSCVLANNSVRSSIDALRPAPPVSGNNVAISESFRQGSKSPRLVIVDTDLNVQHTKEFCSQIPRSITCTSDSQLIVEASTSTESFLLFFTDTLCSDMEHNSIQLPRAGIFDIALDKQGTIYVAMLTAEQSSAQCFRTVTNNDQAQCKGNSAAPSGTLLVLFIIKKGKCCSSITERIKIQVDKLPEVLGVRPSLAVSRGLYIVGSTVRTSDGKNLVSQDSSGIIPYLYLSSNCTKDILLPSPILETMHSATMSENGVSFVCGNFNGRIQVAKVL